MAAGADSKVKDMGLAEFGRKEFSLAEHEMPGLMAIRKEYGPQCPGAKRNFQSEAKDVETVIRRRKERTVLNWVESTNPGLKNDQLIFCMQCVVMLIELQVRLGRSAERR